MPAQSNASRPKIFISYSRRDCSAFAQDLLVGLELLNFDPFLDREDIAAGEDWEARLEGLIHAADTVVYVASPQSVRSERCAWEIEKAFALSKRVIPVVAIAIADEKPPDSLKRLNYIFFNESHTYARSLAQLAEALRADIGWIREHTRLGEIAARWRERGEPEALLLRGAELDAALQWLGQSKSGAPDPTDLQRAFLLASQDAEASRVNRERRQLEEMANAQAARASALADREAALKTLSRRTALGLGAAGALVVASGGLAYWGVDAERRFRVERERAEVAQRRSVDELIRVRTARTDIRGQLVAYAASVDSSVVDSIAKGQGSPYTKTLLGELSAIDRSVQDALTNASGLVLGLTNGVQRPFVATDLNGEIYLSRPTESSRRVALIVGVDEYRDATFPRLSGVKPDLAAWEAFLSASKFKTTKMLNPTKRELERELENLYFEDDLYVTNAQQPYSLGLFYYAGVGYSMDQEQFITAADTRAEPNNSSAVSLLSLKSAMRSQADASIIVLDTQFSMLSI